MNFFGSTKFRLTLWYSAVLGLILTLFAAASYFIFAFALESQTDQTLNEIAAAFIASVTQEVNDDASGASDAAVVAEIRDAVAETNFKSYPLFVFSGENDLIAESKTNEIGAARSFAGAKNRLGGAEESAEDLLIGENPARGFFKSFQIAGKNYFLIVAHPLNEQEELLARIRGAFLIGVPLALFFAGFGGYALARKSLAPIEEMSEKAEEINAQNLHERLPIENAADELGRLAATFNNLLARLDASFERQKRFMADASHELRTPIAVVRGEADVSLSRDEREISEYRETISIIQSEAERMSRIIEDLFTLARADAGESPPRKAPVYLKDVLAETIKSFRTLARKNEVEITFYFDGEMPLTADEQLLRRLFTNVVDNAVKYAKTSVKVEAETRDGFYEVTISDDGDGIPSEVQEHIFERFYRADKARSRRKSSNAVSGAGLGLSISKLIAEIHGGTLNLSKSDARGSVFTVRFSAEN